LRDDEILRQEGEDVQADHEHGTDAGQGFKRSLFDSLRGWRLMVSRSLSGSCLKRGWSRIFRYQLVCLGHVSLFPGELRSFQP
jgi:hypothetical protein